MAKFMFVGEEDGTNLVRLDPADTGMHELAQRAATAEAETKHLRETLKAVVKRQRNIDAGVLKIVTIIRTMSGLEP